MSSSSSIASVGSSLTHAACFVPNSRRRSSRAGGVGFGIGDPQQQPRRAVARAGALVVELQPPGAHEVHEQREVAGELDDELLAAAPDRGDRAALERRQRRVEGLQRVDARRHRGLDRRAAQRRVEPAGGDLDLGQLGHTVKRNGGPTYAPRHDRRGRSRAPAPAASRCTASAGVIAPGRSRCCCSRWPGRPGGDRRRLRAERRAPARRYAARGEEDQGALLEGFLAERGTTAQELVVALLAELDVEAHLLAGGLTGDEIAALRARLLGP